VRDDGFFGDDDDAVADVIKFVVNFVRLAGGRDDDVVSDARVLVNDGVLNFAMGADANARLAFAFEFVHRFLRLVIIAAESDDAVQLGAVADDGAQTHDAVRETRAVDDATVGEEGVVDDCAIDFGTG